MKTGAIRGLSFDYLTESVTELTESLKISLLSFLCFAKNESVWQMLYKSL